MVLVFASTHAAMAAEDALREAGIALQVIPLPAWVAADCGLALRLDGTDAGRAKEELLRREIQVRGIHEERPEAGLLGDSLERG